MAKPMHGMPGNSGHIHISLCNLEGKNLFARDPDANAQWPDLSCLSETGQFFLAGLLDALPDVMVLFAPTINSYKRFVENYWAPVNLSWGLEDRKSSIRLVAPPVCKPSATRFEVRIPGADLHPHYALNALLTAGWRGVQKKLHLRIAPLSTLTANDPKPQRLPQSLEEALRRFTAPESISRELFDAEFIEYFARSRGHELRLWREAVTDWYVFALLYICLR
jgi:glutamine synthetase